MEQVDNPYKLKVIQEQFPLESPETHLTIYNLDLEKIDRYGVALSPVKVYESVALTNSLIPMFPEFAASETMMKPEYLRSAYVFVTVLHNLHKVTGQLIFTQNLNYLYRVILNSHADERHMGYSILLINQDIMRKLFINAFQICKSLGKAATENDYLEIIVALQIHYSLPQQWLLFTKTEYDLFKVFEEIPSVFLSTILED